MAKFNRSVAPYYDDYDSSKQYTHLLALPGRVAQAREITQLQSTMKGIIKSVGDSILRDGEIVEGCQVSVINSNKTKVKVSSGKIYMNGMVLPVPESEVAITGIGTEVVGVILRETLVTEQEDSSLKDPAVGYNNYDRAGCYRVKSELIVTSDNPDTIINTLIDGEIAVEKYTPEYDQISQTLARRTYDESGSYLVNGLKVRVEDSDTNHYNVVVEAGKAYILGYELKIPSARRLSANRSTTYSTVSRSRKYETEISEYKLYNNPYVKDIISVKGTKKVTESQSISANTQRRSLSHTPVVDIVSVTYGSTEYEVGQNGDCYLDPAGGDVYYLQWNGTENYPPSGSQYQVTYNYTKEYVNGVDYELVLIGSEPHLKWIGDVPEDDTYFEVRFNQYLARRDVVYIDKYGNLATIEGVPAEYDQETTPEAPLNTLTLAIIINPPNGSAIATASSEKIIVNNVGLTRFTMNDIQSIVNRITTIEYDQALISLNTEAKEDSVSNKKGIIVDPLIDLSRIDYYYNKSSSGVAIDATKPVYSMALDLNSNIAYLPVNSKTTDLVYDTDNSTSKLYSKIITLGATGENTVLSQTNATKSFHINPYSMFPQLPEVSVTPSIDSWIEDTIIEVPVSLSESSVVAMSTKTIDNRRSNQINNSNYRTDSTVSVTDTAIGTKTDTYSTDTVISENSIEYIRQRELTVEGFNFPASLDNIKCYFDGILVSLTPATGTASGTETGSVKSNESGYLKATFTIPSGVITGSREVKLKSDIVRDGYSSEGFTLYIAQGTSRTVQRTVTTVTTILLQRTTTTTLSATYVDPVGQTFVLDRMTILKGIDLYFENKPQVNTPVVCEIREVNNGTITSQVYAHSSLNPSQVNTSSNGSVATRFNFEDPVLLDENTEYAFVIRSTSPSYTIWVAELGETDKISGSTVLQNPYLSGVMMSSSNNSSWTTHQTMDVKFNLIEDVYANNSVIEFNSITVPEFSRIYLAVESAIPEGTSVAWKYSTDGSTYYDINTYNITHLETLRTNLNIRANLSKLATSRLTPMISLDSATVITSCYETSGTYIMKNVSNLDAYSNVKIIVDVYNPTGDIAFKFSKDDGATLLDTTLTKTEDLSYNWKECTYTATVTGNPTQCRIFAIASAPTKTKTPAFRRLRVIFY